MNRRVKIHLLSIALRVGSIVGRDKCSASAKALRSDSFMDIVVCQYHWMLWQIIVLCRMYLAQASISGLIANEDGVSIGSKPKVRLLVRKEIIPRSVADKRKCDNVLEPDLLDPSIVNPDLLDHSSKGSIFTDLLII